MLELKLDEVRLVEVDLGKGAGIVAEIVPSDEVAAMAKRHTRTKVKHGVPTEKFDSKAFGQEFWGRTIHSWSGICAPGGGTIPCDTEHKFAVMSQYPEIAQKVTEAIEEAQEKTFEDEASAQKNSSTMADGQ